jgi:hypothetical protein
VTPVNDVPLAIDDGATTDEDTAISIAVLTNDALGDEPTTITSVTQGSSGSVAIDPGATTVTYTPDGGFTGQGERTKFTRESQREVRYCLPDSIANVLSPEPRPTRQWRKRSV